MAKLEVQIQAQVRDLKKGLSEGKKALEQFETKLEQLNTQQRKNAILTARVDKALEDLNRDYKSGAVDINTYTKGVEILEGRQLKLANNAKRLSQDLSRTKSSIKALSSNAAPELSSSLSHAGRSAGQAGIQIQQFVGQVQGGQSFLVAFSQQAADLGFVLGAPLAGAITAIAASLVGFLIPSLVKAADVTKEFTKSLNDISTGSIVEFQTLTDIVLDTNSSFREQQRAITILKDKYQDFDTSLLTTKGNLSKAKKAVDDYTNSLIKQAKAKAALSLIESKFAKIIKLEEERANARKKAGLDIFKEDETGAKILKTEEDINKEISDILKKRIDVYNAASDKEKAFRTADNVNNFKIQNDKLNDLKDFNKKEIDELLSQIQQLSKLADIRSKVLAQYRGGGFDSLRGQASVLDSKIIPTVAPTYLNLALKVLPGGHDIKILESSFEKIREATKLIGKKYQEAYNVAFTIDPAIPTTSISNFQIQMVQALLNLNDGINNIIQNNLTNTFAGIGQAIGNALSGAGNLGENLAKVLLSSVGSLLTQLGKLAIAIGVGLAKIKAALKSLNPALAIGAGVGLIALGTVFSKSASRLGGSIGDGGVTSGVGGDFAGGGFGSTGISGGNRIFGSVVFRIEGTDFVGVLNNTLEQNGIFGGNITVGSN